VSPATSLAAPASRQGSKYTSLGERSWSAMTMPGFTAEASLYESRGHYYCQVGQTFGQGQGVVGLAQAVGGPRATAEGAARCMWPDPSLPSNCRYQVQAWYDISGEALNNPPGTACFYDPNNPPPPGRIASGEATWTGPLPQAPHCTLRKRMFYDGNCRLFESVATPSCAARPCPEGWDDCIRNCRNEGGSGPECSRECIQRGCD